MEAARRRAHPITCACLQIKAPARPMLMPNKTWSTWVRKWTMIWRLMGTRKTLLTEIISQILGASDLTISHHYKIHRRMELERRHRAIWISRSYAVWLRPKISSYPSNISSNSKVHHWRTTECDWIQIFWIVFVTVAKRKSISAILIYVSPSIFSLQLATRHKRPQIQFAKPFFALVHDMCINSCVAYTGPLRDLEICPECGEPRYDPIKLAATAGEAKVARQEFYTIPIGPQLQAFWRNGDSAQRMRYRDICTAKILADLKLSNGFIPSYDDLFHGSDYLEAVNDGHIEEGDVVLMFSIDGAQLYRNKLSDCWIYIWIIFNFDPVSGRYIKKCVLRGRPIPGPNKPKILE